MPPQRKKARHRRKIFGVPFIKKIDGFREKYRKINGFLMVFNASTTKKRPPQAKNLGTPFFARRRRGKKFPKTRPPKKIWWRRMIWAQIGVFSEASSFFNDHKLSIRQDCCCKSVVACLSTPFQTMKWGAVDRVGARRQTGQVAIEYHVLTPPKYGPSINRTSVQRILIQFCFSSKPNQNHEALGKLYILSPPLKKKKWKKIY